MGAGLLARLLSTVGARRIVAAATILLGAGLVALAVSTVGRTLWMLRGDLLLAEAVERRVGGLLGSVRSAVELEAMLPVLESGEHACVFRDEEAGCWFSQRA